MRRLGNTLYVTTQGTYLSKDGDCILVAREDHPKARIPMHNVDGLVCFGQVSISPFLLGACAKLGITISWFDQYGRFLARAEGPVSGNVRLRRMQYAASDVGKACVDISRSIVLGKVANQRYILQRYCRDYGDELGCIEPVIRSLGVAMRRLDSFEDMDSLRGCEGDAARGYFSVFPHLIRSADPAFCFTGRNRRPPLDAVNCLLSFIYTLLTHDARSALEGVGLDPQVGFLHRERPGRPSLALDLMEEFRPWFADRLVLSLINRGQLQGDDFESSDSGAVTLKDDARRTVLTAYQERKAETLKHPFTQETLSIGLLWHMQARLLAMHLRGDLDAYPPFLPK